MPNECPTTTADSESAPTLQHGRAVTRVASTHLKTGLVSIGQRSRSRLASLLSTLDPARSAQTERNSHADERAVTLCRRAAP
jgi:hypothetical protein